MSAYSIFKLTICQILLKIVYMVLLSSLCRVTVVVDKPYVDTIKAYLLTSEVRQ